MSYEYSSEQAQLDFPNPYRIENMLWAARALILLLCAVALLFLARKHLAAQAFGSFVVPVVLGVGLLMLALWNFVVIGKQLRVFFGRGQPAGLAQELQNDQLGVSAAATTLMQTVRQGALEFDIPKGPLNGVLYSIIGNLITAPRYIQSVLQNRFANLAVYVFLLIIMGVSTVFVWGAPVQPWIGAFYLGLVCFMAVKPVSGGDAGARLSFNMTQIVLLTLAAILGPVLLGMVGSSLPDLSWATFGTQALIILLALAAIEVVFFFAVRQHIDAPPPVSKVDVQTSVSFNSDPNLLMQELDREMQRGWVHRIPNRRYARVLPQIQINQGTGNFKGLLVEESQPMAPSAFSRLDWSVVRAYPRFLWLTVIDLLGVLLTLVGAVALVLFAVRFDPMAQWQTVVGYASLGISLVAVGGYAFRSAHTLWGRFDFESRLTCVEMEGSYVRSKVDIGNRLQDRVFSERDVINVENMTLRVWVMQLRSVVFGHQSQGSATQRVITGMMSLPRDSEYMAELVRRFAGEQSIVVAPTAVEDARRMAAIGSLNHVGHAGNAQVGLPAGALSDALLQAAQPAGSVAQATVSAAPRKAVFCTHCGTPNDAAHAFCESCGTALAQPLSA